MTARSRAIQDARNELEALERKYTKYGAVILRTEHSPSGFAKERIRNIEERIGFLRQFLGLV